MTSNVIRTFNESEKWSVRIILTSYPNDLTTSFRLARKFSKNRTKVKVVWRIDSSFRFSRREEEERVKTGGARED